MQEKNHYSIRNYSDPLIDGVYVLRPPPPQWIQSSKKNTELWILYFPDLHTYLLWSSIDKLDSNNDNSLQ